MDAVLMREGSCRMQAFRLYLNIRCPHCEAECEVGISDSPGQAHDNTRGCDVIDAVAGEGRLPHIPL